jgi:hypothetical protein
MSGLPFSCFDQLFDFPLYEIAFDGADEIEEQLSVQMIGFVRDAPGSQIHDIDRVFPGIEIKSCGDDTFRTVHFEVNAGETQTTFFSDLFALGRNDVRVDENVLFSWVFSPAAIHDEQSFQDANLWGRQPDSTRGIHRFKHVFDQFGQLTVEIRHQIGRLFESRITVFEYVQYHKSPSEFLAYWFSACQAMSLIVTVQNSPPRRKGRKEKYTISWRFFANVAPWR